MFECTDPVLRRRWRACAGPTVLLSAVLALAGCGNDDEDTPPDATLTVANDVAQTDWNQTVTVNVLANDSASAGALSLSAVGTPAHGTARIESGRLVYTPAAGYFGTDTISYTARAEQGGTTATGSVSVTITAAMSLSGRIADVTLPGAAIRLNVGSSTQTTTADDQGRFTLQLRTVQPADVLSLQATGAGSNAHIKLQSLLGDAQAFGALANATGAISADNTPLLRVSPASTALASWVTEANGTTAPNTRSQIDALILRASPAQVRNMATAIKLVASAGAALPAGVADTLALVASPISSKVFFDFVTAHLDFNNTEAYQRWQAASSLAIVDGMAPIPDPAATQARTWVYFIGYRQEGYGPLTVTYRPDGTATIVEMSSSRAATWRIEDGMLKLSYVTPVITEEPMIDTNGNQWMARITERGHEIRAFSAHMTRLRFLTDYTWVTGPNPGGPVPISGDSPFILKAVALDSTPAIAAADLPVGTVWAGLQVAGLTANETDLLEITGTSAARLQRSGQALTWAATDGWLQLSASGVDRRYRRLWNDPTGGEEHWLACDFEAGAMKGCLDQPVVKPVASSTFVNDSSLHRRWLSNVSLGVISPAFFTVFADGSGLDPRPATWSVDANGLFTLRGVPNTFSARERTWTLLRKNGPNIYVLENLKTDYVDPATPDQNLWRINVYTDQGSSGS